MRQEVLMFSSFSLRGWLFWTFLCLVSLPVYGQPAEPQGDAVNKRVVMISPESEKEAIDPFVGAVRAQLSDLQVEFDVVWLGDEDLKKRPIEERAEALAAQDDTAAVFWCDLNRDGGPALFLSVPEIDRVLIRRLGGVGEGGMPETTGIIVRASVDEILRGLPNVVYTAWMDLAELEASLLESSTVEIEQKKPTIEIKRGIVTEPDKGERFLIGTAYALEMISSEHLNHGITGDLNLRIASGWYGFVKYSFFPKKSLE